MMQAQIFEFARILYRVEKSQYLEFKILLLNINNYKTKLEIDSDFLFFIRNWHEQQFIICQKKKSVPITCENITTIEFGTFYASPSSPTTTHTLDTLGLDLILCDVEVHLETQY